MASPGWTRTQSPFHKGELALQARLGAQERMDKQGRRFIRDYFTEQHRTFFAQLPSVLVGTVDEGGNPWASILAGQPGFLSTPDNRTLQVAARPLFGDPLSHMLAKGIDIGFLGIELPTRRRNRANGVVADIQDDGFSVHLVQAFGNCPQYIQSRNHEWTSADSTAPPTMQEFESLSAGDRADIATADTFFIATAYQDEFAGLAKGVDVSHRGGKPGFVRIDLDGTLTVPDFSGNCHFNTFGNVEVNPRAGLLFVNFDRGNLLYLTGAAEVIWEGDEVDAFIGAERLFRFRTTRGYRVNGSLPLRWTAPEYSPSLERTGTW